MKEYNEYNTAEKVRMAIARQMARRVHVTDELIRARRAYDEAQKAYAQAIEKAAAESFN